MQLVVLMLIGSMILGVGFKKLDRRAYLLLAGLVLVAVIGYLYFKRFL